MNVNQINASAEAGEKQGPRMTGKEKVQQEGQTALGRAIRRAAHEQQRALLKYRAMVV